MRHAIVAASLTLALSGCGGGGGGSSQAPPGSFGGSGTPTPTGQRLPFHLGVGWFNADAYPDAVIADGVIPEVRVLLGGPNGEFTALAPHDFGIPDDPEVLGTGFFNLDALTDLVVVGGGLHAMLLGNGDGTFTPASASIDPILPLTFATTVAVGEMDGDVFDDLAYGTGLGHVGLALCTGAGTFVPGPDLALPSASEVMAIALGDLNQDNRLDVVVLQDDSTLTAFAGDGMGGLAPLGAPLMIGGTPRAIVTGRFDLTPGDDVAVLDDQHQQVRLFSGGVAPFSPPFETIPLPEFGISIATYPTATSLEALAVVTINADGSFGHVLFVTGDPTSGVWTAHAEDGPDTALAVAVADMNFDGFLDLVVGSAHIEFPNAQGAVQTMLATGF